MNSKATEFNKDWTATNPILFTRMVLDFLQAHPSDVFSFEFEQSLGFFTIRATKKADVEEQAT